MLTFKDYKPLNASRTVANLSIHNPEVGGSTPPLDTTKKAEI